MARVNAAIWGWLAPKHGITQYHPPTRATQWMYGLKNSLFKMNIGDICVGERAKMFNKTLEGGSPGGGEGHRG